jgi:integrase/recombinase XerD
MAKLKAPSFKILKYSYKKLSNGEHPIMIRVTYERQQRYFSLGLTAGVENWNEELGRFQKGGKRLTDQEKDNNILLDRFAAKLEKAKRHFQEVDFSFDRFNKFFFQASNSTSVFKFFQEVVDSLLEEERIGSHLTYKGTLARVKDFRKNKDLSFRDVDSTFIEQFKKHLRTTNSVNSIGIYLRTLKAVYNRAVKKGLITAEHTPWNGLRIETESTRKRALTKDQIEAFKTYQARAGSAQWHSLNYFLFSYYCRGMNFEDIARLTWDDIRNDRIYYVRAKTKDPLDIAIDARIAGILSNYSKNQDFIFPVLVRDLKPITIKFRLKTFMKRVNKDLQEIASAINMQPESKIKKLTMPEDITFYWARHTAATVLKRSGVATAMISEILGHSSEKVTQTYLDSFEKNQLDEIGNYL